MIVTFHFPVLDCRSFFKEHLGRLDGFQPEEVSASGNGLHRGIFLRSIGMPKRRSLGPGDGIINEALHFSLDRVLKYRFPRPNKRIGPKANSDRSTSRYYVLDESVGRVDIGIPVTVSQKLPTREKNATSVYQSAKNIEVAPKNKIFDFSGSVIHQGPAISRIIQSRTTKELWLKDGRFDHPSIYSTTPVMFIEGQDGDIDIGENLQQVPVEIPNVRLFHWYPSASIRSWIILRANKSRQSHQDARLLRMYLSRIYSHQGAFRSAVRNLPALLALVQAEELDDFLIDDYTQFLVSNRRHIRRLSKGAKSLSRIAIGPMARLAHDLISGDEIDQLLLANKAIIKRRNLFNNLREQILDEAAQRETFAGPSKNTNFILNLFGWQRADQEISVEGSTNKTGLAKPVVRKLEILELTTKLSDLFSVYGSQVNKARQDAIAKRIEELTWICKLDDVPGPTALNKIHEIGQLVGRLEFGAPEMSDLVKKLERQVLA